MNNFERKMVYDSNIVSVLIKETCVLKDANYYLIFDDLLFFKLYILICIF